MVTMFGHKMIDGRFADWEGQFQSVIDLVQLKGRLFPDNKTIAQSATVKKHLTRVGKRRSWLKGNTRWGL